MSDKAYGPPSEAAVEAVADSLRASGLTSWPSQAATHINVAHDPAQGRDASVNLGWVLHELEAWALADFGPNGPTPAEYVERRFREWGDDR